MAKYTPWEVAKSLLLPKEIFNGRDIKCTFQTSPLIHDCLQQELVSVEHRFDIEGKTGDCKGCLSNLFRFCFRMSHNSRSFV